VEAQLRAGHPDLQGLCRALAVWSRELRLIQNLQANNAVIASNRRRRLM
jgi:hypothetical protein